MNINDYTYHFCDRFILLFVAAVGLLGTFYILAQHGTHNPTHTGQPYSIGIQNEVPSSKISHFSTTLKVSDPIVITSLDSGNSEDAF